ncbi:hypothetical protein CC1G_00315 [Coprinopsis cinerea okayama7|uniref:DUF1682-domain-containing protein n=1 Tax=Coprinopsis cinerea (strain Okayama-7 / 130 / ATCC MYA-4618 / FGSC 9003) TaxID=240176 RepID=A8NXI6_COPC7|nr:hypothetical protein CC1G_00315 [Coprinopsis cinerea okayama7\|eukprot:XP_001837179.2 hypothetical protein CC1G_00315 [Coprinopsis cinerea okayama7\
MSVVQKFLAGLTPPQVVVPEEYDGWQLRWSIFVFRPALLKLEGLSAHLPLYGQQFSKPQSAKGLVADGYSDFFNFSTGRRNIASLHTIFTLRPRHDVFQIAYQTAKSLIDLHYHPVDDLQLDFKLAPGALPYDFVWAVVAKDELLSVKDNRWDLNYTKTTENPALPPNFSVMSEFADVTENMLKPLGGFSLAQVLQDPKIQPYFRSLSVTDQPRERPLKPLAPEEHEKHVILSLRLPSPSHAADTVPLVSAAFQLIDNLNKINLRPETKVKLKKVREETDKKLKEEAEREKREEEAEAKAAAKRKAQEERMSKLSAADQRKELERERKRNIRKQQGKVVRK